ncbi:MAG: DUF4153 domain-containing protein [Micromonosporaceae bacterium]
MSQPPSASAPPYPVQGPAAPPPGHAWPAPPYPPPPMRGRTAWRFWPDVPGGAPIGVYAAAALAATLTVLTEPYAVVGVAGLLTGLVVAAAPVTVTLTSRAARWRLLRPLPIAAGLAVLALLAVGAVRGAGWLYVLSVLTALGLASYGLAAGRRWPSVLLGAVAVPFGVLRGAPWLVRGLRLGADPGRRNRALRAAVAVLVTALLLLIFGALFASADAAFARVLDSLLPDISFPRFIGRAIVAVAVAGFALGAAYVARTPPRLDRLSGAAEPRRGLHRWEWTLPLGALVLLFAGFVAVQLTVLFGGDEHVLRTSGLTYADYARQGFGQLVLVSVLAIGVLAVVGRWASRADAVDRWLVRLLPGALCLLALVVVASALYRLHLYQEAYGFTRLRLLVDAFELWLGAMYVMILIAGALLSGSWLPRAVVAAGVAALLGLASLNPDAFIAERNIVRYEHTGKLDTYHLSGLSADAVPALDRLPEPQRSCALAPIAKDLAGNIEPWYAYNASRARARELLAKRPVDPDAPCATRW